MKLELKRIGTGTLRPFVLHVDGEIAPGQRKVEVVSEPNEPTKVVVTFCADNDGVEIVETGHVPHVSPNRQGDEFYCHRCGKRWSVDEGDPGCSA